MSLRNTDFILRNGKLLYLNDILLIKRNVSLTLKSASSTPKLIQFILFNSLNESLCVKNINPYKLKNYLVFESIG